MRGAGGWEAGGVGRGGGQGHAEERVREEVGVKGIGGTGGGGRESEGIGGTKGGREDSEGLGRREGPLQRAVVEGRGEWRKLFVRGTRAVEVTGGRERASVSECVAWFARACE